MTPFCALTSGASSDSSMRPTVARSRWPCSMLVKRARLVFSQSCSVLRSVVCRRLSIIVLMLSLSSATSPRASTWIERVRSPLVTAVATSAIARTWVVRLAASRLTLPVRSFQVPAAPGTLACPPSRPSTPTSRATVVTWSAKVAKRVGHVVDRLGERRHLAHRLDGQVLLEVAIGDRGHHLDDAAHLLGQVGRHDVDGVGQILPGAGDARHDRLAAELALGADLARHARHFRREGVELIDHRVDRVLQLEDFAFHIDGDLARQVAARHRGRHLGDVAHLPGQVAGHRVDVVGQVLPGAGDIRHHRLTAEAPFGADLARDARHFRREGAQLVHHRVQRFLQQQDFAAHIDRDLFRQIAVGDRGRHFGDVAHLAGQVATP